MRFTSDLQLIDEHLGFFHDVHTFENLEISGKLSMVRLRWGGDRCVFGGKLQHGLQVGGGVKSKLEKMMVGFLASKKWGKTLGED